MRTCGVVDDVLDGRPVSIPAPRAYDRWIDRAAAAAAVPVTSATARPSRVDLVLGFIDLPTGQSEMRAGVEWGRAVVPACPGQGRACDGAADVEGIENNAINLLACVRGRACSEIRPGGLITRCFNTEERIL